MRPALIAVILGFAAAGCAPGATPPPHGPEPGPAGPDLCRATEHQRLVGRQRSEIPAAPAGATWRVTCTTCPMTMDYNPRRLNILYDEASGIVREVRCG